MSILHTKEYKKEYKTQQKHFIIRYSTIRR